LIPFVVQVTKGKLQKHRVFGDDFLTVDICGVRELYSCFGFSWRSYGSGRLL